jgi:hypothetical protein
MNQGVSRTSILQYASKMLKLYWSPSTQLRACPELDEGTNRGLSISLRLSVHAEALEAFRAFFSKLLA